MSDNNKNIDQLFKEKLENFELSSMDSSWKMLQLVKERNIRLARIFFAKVFFGLILLFSATLYILLPNDSTQKESFGRIENMQEASQANNDLNKENNTSTNINTAQKTTSKALNFSSLANLTNHSYLEQLEQSNSNFKPTFEINTKEEKRLIASESSTNYKNWSQAAKEIVQKTSQAGINSPFDEYAPVINKDGSFMFFTSRRPVTSKEIRKGEGRERIYYAETNGSGWSDAQLLESPINSEKNFNSAVSLSKDGKSLFIYRDDRYGNGDLYESKLIGSKWSSPEALPSPINSEFHESTLSLSKDGNTLYFTSNRDGGNGGMDIWVTQKTKAGMWGTAKNLGNIINTESDEEGVFIHPDGKTLYFSSRGHKGMGGYDIYYTKLENGEWTKPVNLGPEINTKNDDVYFVLEENGTDAYYTSVNPATPNKKDIFTVKYDHLWQQKGSTKAQFMLEGSIISKTSESPIKAQIEIYTQYGQKLVSKIESNSITGTYSIPLLKGESYQIKVYQKGFLYYTEEITAKSTENRQVISKKILLEQLQNNTQFVLDSISIKDEKVDFNQTIRKALNELYQLMLLNPNLKIQLVLETNLIKEDNHLVINQKRIDEMGGYLISKGIHKNRIETKTELNLNRIKTKSNLTVLVNITSI